MKKLSMILHEPTPLKMRKSPPKRINNADVSPMEPGINPKNAFINEYVPYGPNCATTDSIAGLPIPWPTVVAKSPIAVAPE